jgi:hypothetical protein
MCLFLVLEVLLAVVLAWSSRVEHQRDQGSE